MRVLIALVLLQIAVAFRWNAMPVARMRSTRLFGHAKDTAALIEGVKNTRAKGSVVVIKYGGHAMEDAALRDIFYEDVAALYRDCGLIPVLVHGGR
jgi:acetylglutamate kinase